MDSNPWLQQLLLELAYGLIRRPINKRRLLESTLRLCVRSSNLVHITQSKEPQLFHSSCVLSICLPVVCTVRACATSGGYKGSG